MYLQKGFFALAKAILVLADGMADNPIPQLNGKTALEAANTPYMDMIARKGASGTMLTLPEGYPTSSDVANMSVMGYDPALHYTGRGALEAVSQEIELGPDDIAWRCNLVSVENNRLTDYSAGHIDNQDATRLMEDLQKEFGNDEIHFYSGISYRNILVVRGKKFSESVTYQKPDDCQGKIINESVALKPKVASQKARHTSTLLNELMQKSRSFLESHPINLRRKEKANMIWLWSPGKKPSLPLFSEKYPGIRGAMISAVDVIHGLGMSIGMDRIDVPGATGFVDTNYEGKADAAVHALKDHDFIYVHIESPDECSHMGNLALKIQAIEDIDCRILGRIMEQLKGEDITYAILPDHPVPIMLRIHTRDPVPVAIWGSHIKSDSINCYSEKNSSKGSLGLFRGDQLMRTILNCRLQAVDFT